MMDVLEAIRTKRAVRSFQEQPIADAELWTILNAGRRAQSAKNSQPWHFIAIRNKDTLRELSQLGTYAGHLASAGLGVVILTPDPSMRFSILFDAGQSAAYMQLAAWSLGVASSLATIYESDKARDLLGFPADFQAHIAISFGYPRDPEVLHAPPKKGGRLPANEVIHLEKW